MAAILNFSLKEENCGTGQPVPVLIAPPPLPHTQVSVIVPVRNEADTLAETLLALANQVDFADHPLDFKGYEVLVFANNCTDDSAAIARRFAQQHPRFQLHVVEQTLPEGEAHIGRVRRMLMDEAHRRLTWLGAQPGIIASTDGDSRVDRRWIAAILYEIACGADAVGGRTVTDRAERAALDKATKAAYLRFVGYRYLIKQLEDCLDPDPFDRAPHHYQFFGANFAVTHTMYAQAGGMPLVQTSEDVAFYRAVVKLGAKVRHSMLMRVTTSARPQGRAPLGLADRLSQFQVLGQRQESFLVESAAAVEAKLLARHHLRRYWMQAASAPPRPALASQRLTQLAGWLAVPLADLHQAIEQSVTVGELFQQVEQHQQTLGAWQQRWAAVPIEVAIADLRLRLNQRRSRGPRGKLRPAAGC
nr:glycosyltransferase family A protein [Nodosilinea sp. TSF1-S3]MDF0366227.1 glycosyltransferase family A protein [Nodosilinea sp. TSF1-S3]